MKLTSTLLTMFVFITLGGNTYANDDDRGEPEARLSGTTIITTDLETSMRFYTHVLGFRETRIRELSGSANLSVYGLADTSKPVRYTALLPAEWSEDNVYLSSLNLVEIGTASPSALEDNVKRAPLQSEIILAYRVENIDEIMRRAESLDTPVVAPVTPSASGKSVTVTMLDPNGVRVYLYNYVDSGE